jgi:hypothetical protein
LTFEKERRRLTIFETMRVRNGLTTATVSTCIWVELDAEYSAEVICTSYRDKVMADMFILCLLRETNETKRNKRARGSCAMKLPGEPSQDTVSASRISESRREAEWFSPMSLTSGSQMSRSHVDGGEERPTAGEMALSSDGLVYIVGEAVEEEEEVEVEVGGCAWPAAHPRRGEEKTEVIRSTRSTGKRFLRSGHICMRN